jgi:hypothetical protein
MRVSFLRASYVVDGEKVCPFADTASLLQSSQAAATDTVRRQELPNRSVRVDSMGEVFPVVFLFLSRLLRRTADQKVSQ